MSGKTYEIPASMKQRGKCALCGKTWQVLYHINFDALFCGPKCHDTYKRVFDAGFSAGVWRERHRDLNPEIGYPLNT